MNFTTFGVCINKPCVPATPLAWRFCNEDYYLWIRMIIEGNIFVNVPDTLVNVRVGNEMAARRGGWKYFKSEANLQKYMLK